MEGRSASSGSEDPRPSLAAVILTFDEELNLAGAIESVLGLARQIFVVDSFSTDATIDVALGRREQGVQIVQHAFENYSAQWNWALAELPIEADWVLKLDADERVTPEFAREVDALLRTAPADLAGVSFRRRIVFMGRALRWGGFSHYDLRLWRRGRGRFDGREVNEHLIVEGRTRRLASHVLHHDAKTLSEWLEKHDRYASLEALNAIRAATEPGVEPRLFGPPDERRQWLRRRFFGHRLRFLSCAALFGYHFVARLGFLDGARGFQAAVLRAFFFYLADLKVMEHRRTGRLPAVIWPRRGKPDARLGVPPA